MGTEHSRGFINVDELMPQISLEQVAAFYGVQLPDLHRVGKETRLRCFLNCGHSGETGDRTLAIEHDHPARRWKCHHYGCGNSGNLVSLCDLLKPGPNHGGHPRGERFREIAADLRSMVAGVVGPAAEASPPAKAAASAPETPRVNVPLVRSDNERARGLVDLDAKFVVDPAQMPPAASKYFRQRPFLTPEVCRKWRMGYLPRSAVEDRTGGTMRGTRGTVVYPCLSEAGEVLTWFGRDPSYEEKHQQWETAGRRDREPEKFHFVKGFHRGLELFGQHAARAKEPGYREFMREAGLIVVEGPNDVIALDAMGIPAVGLCSNVLTKEQAAKLVRFAKLVSRGRVVLLLDCDPAGEAGAKEALWQLSPQCDVRLAWNSVTHEGRFRGRQPESLSGAEWAALAAGLTCGRTVTGDVE
jgi:5S rRNA maturation endonuclease (ribonuclease M5)